MTQANDIVIVSGVRTAIGTFNGSLKHTHQHDLGAAVIREAIARAGIAPQDIDETIVGNVGQIAESGFIARICQLRAGIPQESTAYSVNRQCGSGLQALADGMMQLQSGQAEVVVACGGAVTGLSGGSQFWVPEGEKVLPSGIPAQNAAILGASALIWNE